MEKKWQHNGTEPQLFIDSEKACDTVRRKVLCNILTESGILLKLVRVKVNKGKIAPVLNQVPRHEDVSCA
jgi:hypothetical protein